MIRTLLLALVTLFSIQYLAEPTFAEPLRVMSFNLRYGKANDGEDSWPKRDWLVSKTVKQFGPDLMGTQETLKFQAEFLKKELPGYTYFGRSRMKTPNEHCGIFFKTDRFTKLAGGHFWLSEQPDVPESKSWDSSLPRMATWVLLHDKSDESAPAILFVNTHFDHRGAQARAESAKLIRKKITQLQAIADQPVTVVTGDFNTAEASEPYKAFLHENKDLVDTFRARHPEKGENEGTFGGFRGNTAGSRIDWILASPKLEVVEAEIDRTEEDGRYPSDHYPVTAVLNRK